VYSFTIKQAWFIERDILKGFEFSCLSYPFQATVTSFDVVNAILTIDKPLPEILQYQPLSFSLTSHEEAPILGVRLITQTALDEDFPDLQLRVGSTKGTNALLEMKGAKTAFFVTEGFKDLLVIGNQSRPDIFALAISRPKPLYETVVTIKEQIDKNGNVIEAIDLNRLDYTIDSLKQQGIISIAICFKNAYRNNIHEKILQQLLQQHFEFVNISTELSPQIKLLNRAQTTVVNAYLAPVINQYIANIAAKLPNQSLKIMTSAGSLVTAKNFYPKDSLFSGPAGGVVGAADIAQQAGFSRTITFDMGGTSTDVARFDGEFDYQFSQAIGNAYIFSPALAIETVAAGGGSICSFDGFKLSVGPESAGSAPGPACYGAGGPITITDVNLLLGRLDIQQFSIPVFPEKAVEKLNQLLADITLKTGKEAQKEAILEGFIAIANEKMAETVRQISIAKGYATNEYALVAFGGAGGIHACGMASLLDIDTILLPQDAGLLSAYGISKANVERFAEVSILSIYDKEFEKLLYLRFQEAEEEVVATLEKDGINKHTISFKNHFLYIRFKGQDACIEIEWLDYEEVIKAFEYKYRSIFGHWVEDRPIELESIRVIATETIPEEFARIVVEIQGYKPEPSHFRKAYFNNQWQQIPVFLSEDLQLGATITGFALLLDRFSTTVIEEGWQFILDESGTAIIRKVEAQNHAQNLLENQETQLELFTNRFMAIAENMGVLLQRTALSVNVKERLDFSCALLDASGELIANAPHIPVHLGSLGVCVRSVLAVIEIGVGDVVITNHPKYGGSHLPDITLISSVYDDHQCLIGYVVNRCHHAEIGGVRPASMPPNSRNLAEEGVVIAPMYFVKNGEIQWESIKNILTDAPFPTRALAENLADLNAALAANRNGENALKQLVRQYGLAVVHHYMFQLKTYSQTRMSQRLMNFGEGIYRAEEFLDDGSVLKVRVEIAENHYVIDFRGSANTNAGNLNANVAIVNSVVVYVLRLLLNEKVPLNDGILKAVTLIIPENSMLNPIFPDDPTLCPAVVGGNVEVSQRLTDTLLKAFGIVACSQGTMNNFLFGNENFGYYETICGGSGAGDGFDGTSGVHTHMTNTRITDPEVMELRYPVYLQKFEIWEGSGGDGRYKGGNGVVRQVTFLENVAVSLLRQHQCSEPYGIEDGKCGKSGKHELLKADGSTLVSNEFSVNDGDTLTIWTPGGGGYGLINRENK
jgi:5-oxoprolinase (ATP-hydrolysing)